MATRAKSFGFVDVAGGGEQRFELQVAQPEGR